MTIRTTKRPPGEITWMDLSTPDVEAAKKFYRQIFGWEYQDTGQAFGHYNMAQTQQHNAAGMAQMDAGAQMLGVRFGGVASVGGLGGRGFRGGHRNNVGSAGVE